MESISLDLLALEQLCGEQKILLDTIYDLRKHGIDHFVDLPQIIVIGDQSSGKSSVLEAISRVRFPVNDGLCTRFATEIVLRTDSQPKIFNIPHIFEKGSFNNDELHRLIEAAGRRLLKGSNTNFSEDVLRIEISSPDVPHLTMVDLPGFYHPGDKTQSTSDRELVERLVGRYMACENSIVLAVISAQKPDALRKMFEIKHHDHQKERTLGIITKPDIISSSSQEEKCFVRLAKNLDQSHDLSLGWHVLRNRSETEVSNTNEERDEKEREFFKSSLWSSVPSKNRGAEALRKKLSGILLGHVKDNLQGLIKSIEKKISDLKTRLKRLGEPRSTSKELRTHLDGIASQFHVICLGAMSGDYADEFFGGLYPSQKGIEIGDSRIRKIRALIRDLNRVFAYILETKGSRRIILPRSLTATQGCHQNPNGFGHEDITGENDSNLTLPTFLQPLANQYNIKDPEMVTFESIASELESLSSTNQGNEFPGTMDDRLVVKLFQDQLQPWEEIARCHIQLILGITKGFVERLMYYIVQPDKKTCSAILSNIVDPFFEKKSVDLESKLQELLYHYKSGCPQPLDTEFRSSLAQKRRKYFGLGSFVNEARIGFEKMTLSKQLNDAGVDGIIDKYETYYEISLRTFTDNIVVLAIENCLIRDLPSIFTTEKVNQMEDDELERLASESPEMILERAELREELDALKKGLQICNSFKGRKATSVSSISIVPDEPSTGGSSDTESDISFATAVSKGPYALPGSFPITQQGGLLPPEPIRGSLPLTSDSKSHASTLQPAFLPASGPISGASDVSTPQSQFLSGTKPQSQNGGGQIFSEDPKIGKPSVSATATKPAWSVSSSESEDLHPLLQFSRQATTPAPPQPTCKTPNLGHRPLIPTGNANDFE
ncbi:P-loop containing nucleoside triphosphate hydrolase protein [Annulohypoxylon bovei var. microspora]|nr:P-loop containing nucleoside triphosphate hydrolase protein [Annulohypoxylon bovei var. microspora]